MSLPPRPANGNDAPFFYAPWATWPMAGLKAWGATTAASLDAVLTLQRAWFEASQSIIRAAGSQRPTNEPDTPVMLAATMDDLRDCSAAVMKAQADVLESWRRSA